MIFAIFFLFIILVVLVEMLHGSLHCFPFALFLIGYGEMSDINEYDSAGG